MIYVVDFGSQTAHLIKRRIRDLGAITKFITPDEIMAAIQKEKPHGIILSGGPASVYDSNSPTLGKEIFSMNIPLLAICYGMQLMMQLLGGTVVSGKKEYGPSVLVRISNKGKLLKGVPPRSTVWMSHGDEVVVLPQGFETIASTDNVQYACVADLKKKLFGMLFHPEVEHTEYGEVILKNFVELCNTPLIQKEIDIQELEKSIRREVGEAYVIGAVSGGVDSTVAAALTARAIGKKFVPFYVDNGLMREGTTQQVKAIFKHLGVSVDIIEVEEEMLERLKGIDEPEEKRKIIGNFYIELFEREMKKLKTAGKDVEFLLQGTIYSDVIESKGTKYASKIKSHHNVLGLPKKMKLKLLEPLRNFYKDEVRELGIKLGLPDSFVYQQPFPGPGYAIRIRGEVTKDRLEKERIADRIVLEELKKAGFLQKVFISFPVLTGAFSTAVKGDGRFFGEVIALRVVESKDVMTSKWSHLPYSLLQVISSRIVNEVPGISRVVYDITTKPPATMEWE
ncbi:MAG: GMP synthase [glutamine-hydrolyzing] [Patescibacteria group bacterium]|nr:MAG: GMP synthase [glutamine-hydrolyzing] [Patescibacteria group bacterium]